MQNLVSINSTLNRREKYSEVHLTYYETTEYPISVSESFPLFWLREPTTFKVGDDKIHIPIESQDEDKKIDYRLIRSLYWTYGEHFPVKDRYNENDTPNPPIKSSQYSIWGEDDNITITSNEFSQSGGSIGIEFNTAEKQWEVIIQPPDSKIGVNENFSLSLEGSVPALVIAGAGFISKKKILKAYTEHYGRVHNVLEIELPQVGTKLQALDALQRLLEKYNTLKPEYSYEYFSATSTKEKQDVLIDNNRISPQTLNVTVAGEVAHKSATRGRPHNKLSSVASRSRTLDEISNPFKTLNEVQYNHQANLY